MRVLRVLKEVDLIAAEDTRNTIKLLNHFEIKTPMTSYHEFNKVDKAKYLVGLLQQGQNIALVTDAGTPGISDPGEELVRQCHEAGVEITALPGAAACITALIQSGLSTRRFCFEAFLPSEKDNKKERNAILEELKEETRTIIVYEAPHRLIHTLEDLSEILGRDRRVCLCKELTKLHEQKWLTSFDEALAVFDENPPRGEYVIVIEGRSRESLKQEKIAEFETMTLEEHMELYLKTGMSQKDAMKKVAKDRGVSKRDIYQALIKE